MNIAQRIGFDAFWLVWPKCRRVGKKQAMQQWESVPTDLYKTICLAVDRQKKQPSWNKDGGAYIPYPHRWLRDRRWEDEVTLPEDNDVNFLIDMIRQHASLPEGLSLAIKNRAIKTFTRMRWTWPLLHHRINQEPEMAEQIKKEFLATD